MSLKKTTKQIGDDYEVKALNLLEQKGYTLLASNYRFKRNEIDLIVQKDHTIVFVEVKFRKNNSYGNPESFVDSAKLDRIIEAADHYIIENDWNGKIRFDIVAIMTSEIIHFEDVC